ncbi:MAG: 2-thiouracil desulfurase family protein [Saprospiraceae bacterium]|nr:2-thiouracil desulfurase family protein [Saprospiraceae bacterium]
MTDQTYLQTLRTPTPSAPLRVLVSACLTGITCGYDGTANGTYPSVLKLLNYQTVRLIRFCPEEFSFGSPREMCDIHGGTGDDVLDGRARVLSDSGLDWTEGMIRGAERMLALAQQEDIELAVMMDISAACGSQVIYDGNRFATEKKYQIGAGVAAALLLRHGFKVISQRDFASLEILYSKVDPGHTLDPLAKDHHETDWYKSYFSAMS